MFRLHIIEEGQLLVKGVETLNAQGKPLTVKDVLEKSRYIEHLLDMLNNYKIMVKDQFNNDALFK